MHLWALFGLLPIFFGVAFGACVFPEEVKSTWWLGYDKADQSAGSWLYQFDDNEIRLKVSTIAFTTVYECISSAVIESKLYYIQKLESLRECVQLYVTSNAILHRTTTIPGEVMTVSDCPAALILEWKSNWLVKEPFPSVGIPCPFPTATYQTRFADTDGDWHCEGDMESKTVVSGTTLDINTCYKEPTSYLFPVKTTLTCIAYAGTEALKGSSVQMERGRILLLADTSTNRFYCARYIINGDTVYVSLLVKNAQQADCSASQDAYSAQPGVYLSLVLYDVVNATTLRPTTKPGDTTTASFVPTTPTTTATPPTTTTPSTTTPSTTITPSTTTPSTTITPSATTTPTTKFTPSTTTTPTTKFTPSTTTTPTTKLTPPITNTPTTTTTTPATTDMTTDSNDVCSSSPCANGGTCSSQNNSYYCICAESFSGTNCNQQAQSSKSTSSEKLVMIVLIVVFAIVVVAVVIVAVLVCQYRNHKKEESLLSKDPSRMYLGLKNPVKVPGGRLDTEDEKSY